VSVALAATPAVPPIEYLLPRGCHTETPAKALALFRRSLQGGHTFCRRIPIAPMPVSHVGRLAPWVEHARPETLHRLCLDVGAEKAVVDLFGKNGIHVQIVRAAGPWLYYHLVART